MIRGRRAWFGLLLLTWACRHTAPDGVPTPATGGEAEPPVVVVLPFTPGGDAPEQLALARAMALETIQWLQSTRLTVIDAATVLALVEDAEDPTASARKLGADTLIVGESDLEGDEVTVRARLVRLGEGAGPPAWSVERRLALSRVAALHAEMALALASALESELLPAAERRARRASRATVDPEAYRAYLLGAFGGEEGSAESQAALARSVALDPGHSAAWAVLADVRTYQACHDLLPRDEIYPEARTAVDRALALDPDNPLAQAAAGHLTWECDWDWEAGERHLERALALAPGSAWVRHLYTGMLRASLRGEEALTVARPLALTSPAFYVFDYVLRLAEAGRSEEAMQVVEENRRRFPEWDDAFVERALLWRQNRYQAVLEYLPPDLDEVDAPELLGWIGWLNAKTGHAARAREALDRLRAQAPDVSQLEVARVLVGLGEEAAALDALEKAFEEHRGRLVHLGYEREWDPLRDEPRFQAIARAVGIRR